MTLKDYEIGLLALAMFRLSLSDSINEMTAVGCVIRNRVFLTGQTYSEVIHDLLWAREKELYQGTPAHDRYWKFPSVEDEFFMDPSGGLLAVADKIYTNELADVTRNHVHKAGALHFCRVTDYKAGDLKFEQIISKRAQHPLIGMFGFQSFFG